MLIADATARDEYIRDYIGVDATYLFNAGGQHQIKGGFQTEQIANDVQTRLQRRPHHPLRRPVAHAVHDR